MANKKLDYGKCVENKCGALVQRKNYKKHRREQCTYSDWNGSDVLYIYELDPCSEEWVKMPFQTYKQGQNKRILLQKCIDIVLNNRHEILKKWLINHR